MTKNAKGALLEVDSDFPEICPSYKFQRSSVWDLKMASTKDLEKDKVVENFRSFILSLRTAQSEVQGARSARFTEAKKSDDGNSGIYIKRENLGH